MLTALLKLQLLRTASPLQTQAGIIDDDGSLMLSIVIRFGYLNNFGKLGHFGRGNSLFEVESDASLFSGAGLVYLTGSRCTLEAQCV